MTDPAQLPRDWWAVTDISHYLDIQPGTVRHYLAIGLLPQPERRIGRQNLWKPRTIIKWNASRARKGDASQ